MSSKFFPTLSGSSSQDLCAEKALKRIKEAVLRIKHDYPYEAPKAASRSSEVFRTCKLNEDQRWKIRYLRNKDTLSRGFLSDPSQPYKEIGKIYLRSDEILMENLTDNFKSQMSRHARILEESDTEFDNTAKTSSIYQGFMPNLKSVLKVRKHFRDGSGLKSIKKRLIDMRGRKKMMHANCSLSKIFHDEEKLTGKGLVMRPRDALHGSTGSEKTIRTDANETVSLRSRLRVTSQRDPNLPRKNLFLHKPAESGDWQSHTQRDYMMEKLEAINSLLSAIINMKAKLVKNQHRLASIRVYRLLQSDVLLDNEGRPIPGKIPTPTHIADDDPRLHFIPPTRSQSPATERYSSNATSISSARSDRRYPLSPMAARSLSNKKKKPRFLRKLYGHLSDPVSRISTWEDLLQVGENLKKTQSPTQRKRDPIYATAVDVSNPWSNLPQAEQIVKKKKSLNFLEDPPKQTAVDVLQKVRETFYELQLKLENDMELECNRHKKHQLSYMKIKFNALALRISMEEGLKKMRTIAQLTSDRHVRMLKPLQWGPPEVFRCELSRLRCHGHNFLLSSYLHMIKRKENPSCSFCGHHEQDLPHLLLDCPVTEPLRRFVDLETEVEKQTGGAIDKDLLQSVENVARFRYEDESSMPMAKEKLCLLVMSMPVHLLLPESMSDAIVFVLERILQSPAEMLHCWLMGRKLDKISSIEKYSMYRYQKRQ